MPLPTRHSWESQAEFIERCMSSDLMETEYPDTDQRLAVCHAQWGKVRGTKEEEKEAGKVERREIDKDVLYHSRVRGDARLGTNIAEVGKAGPKDPGWIEGYAAVWDNVDAQGEIIRKGCFAESIEQRVPTGRVKLMLRHWAHGGDVEDVIGTITEAKEDDYGLWFRARLSSVQKAQDTRTKVKEGHVQTCSIGFYALDWKWITVGEEDDGAKQEVVEHLRGKFAEVTLTVVPANEKAHITAAKSLAAVASNASDIVERLGVPEPGALSDEQRAAFIEEAFGGEAEATALSKAIADLGNIMGCLLDHTPAPVESEDTTAKAAAALNKMDLETRRRRLYLDEISSSD